MSSACSQPVMCYLAKDGAGGNTHPFSAPVVDSLGHLFSELTQPLGEVSHQPAEQALPAGLDAFTHKTNTHASKTFLKKYANATMIADTDSSNRKLPR